MQRINLNPYLTTYENINSKCIKDLNVRSKTMRKRRGDQEGATRISMTDSPWRTAKTTTVFSNYPQLEKKI